MFYPHSVANNDSRACTTYEEGERIPLYEAKVYLKQFHQQKNEAIYKQTGYSNVGFSKICLFESKIRVLIF